MRQFATIARCSERHVATRCFIRTRVVCLRTAVKAIIHYAIEHIVYVILIINRFVRVRRFILRVRSLRRAFRARLFALCALPAEHRAYFPNDPAPAFLLLSLFSLSLRCCSVCEDVIFVCIKCINITTFFDKIRIVYFFIR